MPLLALIVLWILLWQTGCQEQDKTPDGYKTELAAVELSPKITFDKTVHDFGEVAAKKKYKAEFKLKNTGDGVLKITEVKRCCGVIAKLDKKEFEPDESGVLTVEYLSGSNTSLMKRKISVISNDKENPKIDLTISARVVPKVAYEPQRLRLSLKEENAGCPNITLTSVDKKPFSIKNFLSTGNCIAAEVDPSVEATKFVLHPKVDLEKLQRSSSGFISIDLTHPECKKVYLSYSTLLRFEFKPRSIIVSNPKPQRPVVKKLSLVNNYNEDFEVESTLSKNGLVKVLGQQKIDNGYQFNLEITPPPAENTGMFTDVFYVKLKGGQKLSIKCYGRMSIK